MALQIFDRGSPLVVEVEVWAYTPFGTEVLTDPDTITVTVGQSNQTQKVIAQAMTKSVTGKYYYIFQTTSSWEVGVYNVQVDITSGSYEDRGVNKSAFSLK